MSITTLAIGVTVDDAGRIVTKYHDEYRRVVTVDLTDVVAAAAQYVFDMRATSVRPVPPQMGSIANNRYVN